MKAAWIEEFGGPEAIRIGDRPMPVPGPGEVRVRVEACGVCRHDLLTRSGAFPLTVLPVILGHQIAGVVDSVGEGVDELSPGQRVLSMVYQTCGRCAACLAGQQPLCRERPRFLGEDLDGGYAEFVVATASVWVPLPPDLEPERGALAACSLGTAYHAIVSRGGVRAGERVVVTGASGGVGMQAVAMLRAFGALPIAVTRRDATVPALEGAGAEAVVVAEDGSYRHEVKRLTGDGADLVLDIVGGAGLGEAMHSARPGGRIVVLGNVEGGTAEIRPALLILKELTLLGTKSVTRDELRSVVGLVSDGVLQIDEPRVRPLDEAVAAHSDMERGLSAGRTVLVPTSL